MKHPWTERLKIQQSQKLIDKYYDMYHLPCAESVIDFINRFCITMDPRKLKDREIPFELFDRQEEYIRWLWNQYTHREDGVTDKCRGVGMSWMNAAFSVFLLLFQDSVTISMYTYKADECHEKGNIDTLIEKVIFMLDRLPERFKNGVEHKLMQVKNTSNGSMIVGKSGDSPGRGGRSSIYFLDECAFYPRADSIEAAVSRNADCKIWGSTHHGTNTLFYRKCTSGINSVFVFDWWQIPLFSQKWYDEEKAKAEAEGTLHIFQQEVERNAAASLESVCCPSEWVMSCKRIEVKNTGKKIAALDPANEGGDTHGFVCLDGNVIIYADESGEGDPGDATDKYYWKAHELGCTEFRYDPIGVGVGVAQRLKEIKLELQKTNPDHPILKMKIKPWNAGGPVMRKEEMDYAEKKNGEFFENAKAQAWWKVREEFLNTYRSTAGKPHDKGSIISLDVIPKSDDAKVDPKLKVEKLLLELSQPQFTLSKSGKTMINKKPKGTKSPNLADALIIAKSEIEEAWLSWSTV